MTEKVQTFLINVEVIEGRHYIWPNMTSAVLVHVGNRKKYSAVKSQSDCPFYNEYFVFEFSTARDQFLNCSITITVFQPGSIIKKRKILGSVTLDVATVWYQPDHQFYHKWAILSPPQKENSSGVRGYVKLNISALSKGEIPTIPPNVGNTNEIEGNLLLPEGKSVDRQKANFNFDIYRGDGLTRKLSLNENKLNKVDNSCTTSIQISFANQKARTSPKKGSNPVWNERLTITELFPPLCQRFKIELHHGELAKSCTSLRYLNLHDISNDKEEGFLPTFGPTFLHFYSNNPLVGYLGKILISLRTEFQQDADNKSVGIQAAPVVHEDRLFRNDSVLIFASIFEVSAIGAKWNDKPISFRLSCGHSFKDPDNATTSMTVPMKPLTINKDYCHLSIQESKPCVTLALSLPDFRKRMYHNNVLVKITKNLRVKLDEIEDQVSKQEYNVAVSEAELLIGETLFEMAAACDKYIDIVSTYKTADDITLDQEKWKISLKEMTEIREALPSIYDIQSRRKRFQKLEKFCRRIEALVGLVEDWPRIYFWMIYGGRRVAYYVTDPKNVIFSMVEEEKGEYCNAHQTVFFRSYDKKDVNCMELTSMACKMDVRLWMGLHRHWDHCLKHIPQGFECNATPIPRSLLSKQSHSFQCRAHIFQGQFPPGSDKSGLCDPYVQVILSGQCRQTQILKKTLSPIWDQTLTFDTVILYGSKSFIREHPPNIFTTVYDRDEFLTSEIIGRCLIPPVVIMLDEPHQVLNMRWWSIQNRFAASAKILAAIELIEISKESELEAPYSKIVQIPYEIKPHLVTYKIEVMFWGMRNLRKVQMQQINKPKVVVECVGSIVMSDTLVNAKKNLNFNNPIKSCEVVFPEQAEYAPPLCLKLFDCRNFGINIFAGTCISSAAHHLYVPMTVEDRNRKLYHPEIGQQQNKVDSLSVDSVISMLENQSKMGAEAKDKKDKWRMRKKINFKKLCKRLRCSCKKKKLEKDESAYACDAGKDDDGGDFDWWTKFYASLEEPPSEESTTIPSTRRDKLTIYPNELEFQPEFNQFRDNLQSFPIYKGKRTGDEAVDEENTTASFKGSIRIYRWPPAEDSVQINGSSLKTGVFQDFPGNAPLRFTLRIYCIRAIGLRPKDLNGKSDPYICITLNRQVINDKENKVMRQVNPIFGRCYELHGVFPQDHSLIIAVYDWDLTTADDLIGETKIDLENRFYTRHRAHCGLPDTYQEYGYCQWRDQHKPSTILESLCKKWNIPGPIYSATSVKILHKELQPDNFHPSGNAENNRQVLALTALRRWQEIPVVGYSLVPEHVETRSLFHPHKPGIEQGKLQIWIDILPHTDFPAPPCVDISPRKPASYELRVIIWNVENIQMDEDDFFTGEKKSDIYVKGWLAGPESAQYTDIHYRSLSGEGNFNWRLVFPFEYLSTENKLVIRKKESIFALDETEFKLPCRLNLQVWDNDSFSKDDFLGTLVLELSRLPRGARTSKKCSLEILSPGAPAINLFKARRTKGWWPFRSVDPVTKTTIFAGSAEIELELLPADAAELNRAGLGRDEPQGLPKPKRPDTSFSWFRNPLKACKFVIKVNKWKMIVSALLLLGVFLLVLAVWAFPGYIVKKILHA